VTEQPPWGAGQPPPVHSYIEGCTVVAAVKMPIKHHVWIIVTQDYSGRFGEAGLFSVWSIDHDVPRAQWPVQHGLTYLPALDEMWSRAGMVPDDEIFFTPDAVRRAWETGREAGADE
jgi:hypothetical protein